jgi:hypothetical protein
MGVVYIQLAIFVNPKYASLAIYATPDLPGLFGPRSGGLLGRRPDEARLKGALFPILSLTRGFPLAAFRNPETVLNG